MEAPFERPDVRHVTTTATTMARNTTPHTAPMMMYSVDSPTPLQHPTQPKQQPRIKEGSEAGV